MKKYLLEKLILIISSFILLMLLLFLIYIFSFLYKFLYNNFYIIKFSFIGFMIILGIFYLKGERKNDKDYIRN